MLPTGLSSYRTPDPEEHAAVAVTIACDVCASTDRIVTRLDLARFEDAHRESCATVRWSYVEGTLDDLLDLPPGF